MIEFIKIIDLYRLTTNFLEKKVIGLAQPALALKGKTLKYGIRGLVLVKAS